MFLQNLTKNIRRVLKKIDSREFDHFLHNSYRDLLILGVIFVVLVGAIFGFARIVAGGNKKKSENQLIIKDDSEYLEMLEVQDEILLGDLFEYPEFEDVSINIEYKNFITVKNDFSEQLEGIMTEIDDRIEDTLDEDCMFNFEKRMK